MRLITKLILVCLIPFISFLASGVSADEISTTTSNQTVGLIINDGGAFDGYTLSAPMMSDTTYLIDNEGNLVHCW